MKYYSNVLYKYNKNQLDLIIEHNKINYNTSSIIYVDPYFYEQMIEQIIGYPKINKEETETNKYNLLGYVGIYQGNMVICMSNFIKNYAIIVPNAQEIREEIINEN